MVFSYSSMGDRSGGVCRQEKKLISSGEHSILPIFPLTLHEKLSKILRRRFLIHLFMRFCYECDKNHALELWQILRYTCF